MHGKIHSDRSTKYCHYFNNGKVCPFEELGCKFLHILSEKCKFDQLCYKKLCSYQHSGDIDKTVMDKFMDKHVEQQERKIIENLHTNRKKDSQYSCDEMEDTKEFSAFQTSTPKKSFTRCEECLNTSECTECIVKHMLGRQLIARTSFF
jgi:hypothetical protein